MSENPFAALGLMFAGVVADRMVDAYVTPSGITQLMAGERPEIGEDKATLAAKERRPFCNASTSYESIDKFVIRVKDERDGET